MKTHNYFTIDNGGNIEVATNVVFSLKDAIKNNRAFAKFIAFGSGGGVGSDGKIKNIVKVLPVTLTDINPDPTKGILHAQYSCEFGIADKGITFSELSLCSFSDGGGAVNYAECQSVIVGLEPCEVSVMIFAQVSGVVQLCGGDNIIARFLLGERSLAGRYEMACGQCTYPNKPLARGEDTIVKRVVITPIFSESGILFESTGLSSKLEFLVLIDDKSVLRVLPDYKMEYVNGICKVNLTLNAGVEPRFSYEVTNVSMEGQQLTSYEATRSISSTTLLKDILPFNLGSVSRLLIDDEMRYIACVTANDVILLDSDISGFKIVMRLAYNGEFVEVLSGGAIALWADTLKIYKTAEDAPYTLSKIPLERGSSNAIVRDGEYYHAARLSGGVIQRYKIDGNAAELVATVTAGIGQYLIRDGIFITYFGAKCPIGVVTLAQNNAFAESYILELCEAYPDAIFTASNGMVYCRSAEDSFVMHLDSQSIIYSAPTTSYALGNEVYASINGAETIIGYIDRWAGGLLAALTIVGGRHIMGICKTEYFIIVLYEDGKLEGIYLNSSDISLYSPDFVYNKSVNYICKRKVIPPDSEVGKVKMELLI